MEERPAAGTETKGTHRKSGDRLHGKTKQITTRWTADQETAPLSSSTAL
jgi:hypothetical protein